MYELYKKQVEAWKERFEMNFDWGLENSAGEYGLNVNGWEQLTSSRHQDTIELLEAEIERKKGLKKVHREFECNGAHGGKGCYETWCDMETCTSKDAIECKGYNQCLDEDIAYLEGELRKFKNEQ